MSIEEKLTLGKYQLIASIPDDQNPFTTQIQMVSIIENKEVDEIRTWTPEKVKETITAYSAIDLTGYEKRRVRELKMDGEKYTLYDNPAKMTSGQFIDLVEALKGESNPVQVADKVIAIIAVKKGEKYDGTTMMKRASLVQNLPLAETWGVFIFFLNLYWRYIEVTETYLEAEMKRTTDLATELLKNDGVGS